MLTAEEVRAIVRDENRRLFHLIVETQRVSNGWDYAWLAMHKDRVTEHGTPEVDKDDEIWLQERVLEYVGPRFIERSY